MEQDPMLSLLSATAQGDKKAFAELYQASSKQLYAVSLKMLKRKELAEEALQEAYVRIWHNASQYRAGKGTVLTWMISIARYRALDILRYHSVRKEEGLSDNQVAVTSSNEPMTETQQGLLEKCMGALDVQQRQAIHLAYFNGMSHHEVTAHLDLPLGTIKSWIRRGLQSLQRCLKL
ncbi:sigma-70 family RNA polymerase sigma factor [Paraglaciecola agarilytica]|uniref:sigma-70 family RNA polymerase sigma factor n=1 Tax=Paraglaciecola chathamensis TaxID=368405 RepID=UPI001C096142|nr:MULTISPECIES: sigma-70 family RNA polymerase sigma factor [Paraglaciecola]MBU3017613.1 sigma-70 family RNA polymerase sigma factor [Paraglaciecola agarilytica]MDO6558044.1 sigma-70 family RNA polymerase sigma factor [Paraglaciecola chathamensis]